MIGCRRKVTIEARGEILEENGLAVYTLIITHCGKITRYYFWRQTVPLMSLAPTMMGALRHVSISILTLVLSIVSYYSVLVSPTCFRS
jgi:hypothetical protein